MDAQWPPATAGSKREVKDMNRVSVAELLEAAPDAMLVSNQRGQIVVLNAQAAQLFGYPRAELLDQPVELLIPERYQDKHRRQRARYFADPTTRPIAGGAPIELFGRRRDGTEFPAEISLSPLHTDDGILAISAIRDTSERIRSREEHRRLAQAQEMIKHRDDILSIAAHELRTPLTALLLQMDRLVRDSRGPQADNDARLLGSRAQPIVTSLQQMATLINRLLDVTQIATGQLKLDLCRVDLSKVVREVLDQYRDQAAGARCQIAFDPSPVPLTGSWDSLRIGQVVTNLISNAIKYGAGSVVEVTTSARDGGAAVVSVRDHGIGIALPDQRRIFERFERVASEGDAAGLGLGLWITQQIVEAHGGSVCVSSQPGAGSLFTVELPRSA
jgi:protein-histidine pros-kinase